MKYACMAVARVEQVRGISDYQFSPWLDVYHRVAQSVPATPLRVAPVPEALGLTG